MSISTDPCVVRTTHDQCAVTTERRPKRPRKRRRSTYRLTFVDGSMHQREGSHSAVAERLRALSAHFFTTNRTGVPGTLNLLHGCGWAQRVFIGACKSFDPRRLHKLAAVSLEQADLRHTKPADGTTVLTPSCLLLLGALRDPSSVAISGS